MTRQESIRKIKDAFENNQLGFQKGAAGCRYYDKDSDSCCAVGILMDESERRYGTMGDVTRFSDTDYSSVKDGLISKDLKFYKGLSITELGELQTKHDRLIAVNHLPPDYHTVIEYKQEFKDYLYSLK